MAKETDNQPFRQELISVALKECFPNLHVGAYLSPEDIAKIQILIS